MDKNNQKVIDIAIVEQIHEGPRSSVPVLLRGSRQVPLIPSPSADPRDPLNWSRWKKRLVLTLTVSFYFLFTFITTVTVPTFPQLQEYFDITYSQVNYTVAVPALALAVSPLFWSPLADTFGRRIVMIIGCLLAFGATIGSAVAKTYAAYMICRFLQGWGVGPASTVGLSMLQDIYFEHERGEKVGYWTLALDVGLLFGPLIGGFAALVSPHFPAWLTAIIFAVLLVTMVLFLPETAYPRHSPHASQTGDAPSADPVPWFNFRPLKGLEHPRMWDTTIRAIRLFAYPNVSVPVMFYCWTWYWFILCPITMIPAAYPTYTPQSQGLLFLGLIVGTLIAESFFSGRLSDRLTTFLADRSTSRLRLPEYRLPLYWPSAFMTAIGLTLFGCSVQFHWHWITGQIGLAVLAFGIQIGNTITVAYIIDCYPHRVMDLITFYSFHLNLSAFASPFFIVPWVDKSGWAWSFGAQGLIVAGAAVICVGGLQLWGGRVRGWKGKVRWDESSVTESSQS